MRRQRGRKAFADRLKRLTKRRDASGRRRPTQLRENELHDVQTLHAAGYTIARIAELLDRSEATIARVVAERGKALREEMERPLLDAYKRSAMVAAENGDHRPALEMLDRLGVIPETSKQRTALAVAQMTSEAQKAMVANGAKAIAERTGPTVNIGIGLPSQLGAASPEIRVFGPNECPEKVTKTGEILPTLQHKVGRVLQGAEDTGEG